jgi:hypothetical protein
VTAAGIEEQMARTIKRLTSPILRSATVAPIFPGSLCNLSGLAYAKTDIEGVPVFITSTFLHSGATCANGWNHQSAMKYRS